MTSALTLCKGPAYTKNCASRGNKRVDPGFLGRVCLRPKAPFLPSASRRTMRSPVWIALLVTCWLFVFRWARRKHLSTPTKVQSTDVSRSVRRFGGMLDSRLVGILFALGRPIVLLAALPLLVIGHLVLRRCCSLASVDGLQPQAEIDSIGGKVSAQAQAQHIEGTPQWTARGEGGYFKSPADAQAVLDAVKSGQAQVMGRTANGQLLVRYNCVTDSITTQRWSSSISLRTCSSLRGPRR
jgi:hypothetical protein